ncbi:hypothetical protein PN36_28315 [Candidatus Thiomargarita nelsonii]|uniref:DUF7450 domain-containing protein n=1 Tax=Candidatus Thiomargarita nelsonii TaxID=1003181 RepID=A0A0A6P4X9_9GAMM|nr:hypothetical protein PN36_28315 [Candidatus Thiomargarita nelsonii]
MKKQTEIGISSVVFSILLGWGTVGFAEDDGVIGEPPPLDHFKCYSVKGKKIQAKVELLDQFDNGDPRRVKVVKPVMLCNPVVKWHNNEEFPVLNPEAHLVCYKIKPSTEGPRVIVANQFGEEQILQVQKSKLLCVPSQKFILQDETSE